MNHKLLSLLLLSGAALAATPSIDIEPTDQTRFPISQDQFDIITPGLYVLVADIVGTVSISNSNVTLDLNGYTISGGQPVLFIDDNLTNVTVKNGAIINPTSNFESIEIASSGNDLINGIFENLSLTNNNSGGTAISGFADGCQFNNITIKNGWNQAINLNGSSFCALNTINVSDLVPIAGSSSLISLLNFNGLTIKDCTLDSFVGGANVDIRGIRLNNCTGGTINNCLITNLTTGANGSIQGIRLENSSSNINISNCLISDLDVGSTTGVDIDGIIVADGSNSTSIENCTIAQLFGTDIGTSGIIGINIAGNGTTGGRDCIIKNCSLKNISADGGDGDLSGIRVLGGVGNTIQNCEISRLQKIGVATAPNPDVSGIILLGGTTFASDGVVIESCNISFISDNAIDSFHTIGIRIDGDCDGCIVRNNNIANINRGGATSFGSAGIAVTASNDNHIISGNQITDLQSQSSNTGVGALLPAGIAILQTAGNVTAVLVENNSVTALQNLDTQSFCSGYLGATATGGAGNNVCLSNIASNIGGSAGAGPGFRFWGAGNATSVAAFTATTVSGVNNRFNAAADVA